MIRSFATLLVGVVSSLLFTGGQDFKPSASAASNSDIVATDITALSDAPRCNADQEFGESTDLIFKVHFDGILSGPSSQVDATFPSPEECPVQLGNSMDPTPPAPSSAPPSPCTSGTDCRPQ
jgi:hypothetical protein